MVVKLFRRRIEVGKDYRSDDGRIEGIIIQVWPIENGSEALVRSRSTGEIVRVFIASEKRSETR